MRLIRPALSAVLLLVAACNSNPGLDESARNLACETSPLKAQRTVIAGPSSGPVIGLLEEGEVVLTFDDGPHPYRTPRVLNSLAEHCVTAVFFLQGNQVERSPRLARRILDEGHALGSHTYGHPNLIMMAPDAALAETLRGKRVAEIAAEEDVTLFRYPFVAFNTEIDSVIRGSGLIPVEVTTDARDWTDISHKDGVERIMAGLEANGRRGVVLLHDPFPDSQARTDLLLERLRTEGYRTVALVAAP